MSLFLIVLLAFVALQFTSGIAEFIATNKAAAKANTALGWLATKIGLAPSIITTRVVIIAAFVAIYIVVPTYLLYVLIAGAIYYLYKTGKYLVVLKKVSEKVSSTVVSTVEKDVEAKIDKVL